MDPTDAFGVFDLLEKTPKTNDKIAVLRQLDDWGQLLLKLALDPNMMFKTQDITDFGDSAIGDFTDKTIVQARYLEFLELADTLVAKKALTKADREGIEEFLVCCSQPEAKWYRRVLLKDMRIKVAISLANTAFPSLVDVRGCAGAYAIKLDKPKTIELCAGADAEPKADGYRGTAYLHEGKPIEMYSRQDKPIVNFPRALEALAHLEIPRVYDGEVYIHERQGFNRISHYFTSKEPCPDSEPYIFVIFDCVKHEEWGADQTTCRVDRMSDLHRLLKASGLPMRPDPVLPMIYWGERLATFTSFRVRDFDHALAELERYLKMGFEGLMLKQPLSPYKLGKSNHMLKLKQFYDIEARITGFYPGKKGTKYEHILGGVILEITWDLPIDLSDYPSEMVELLAKNEKIVFECGGGFSDQHREEIWANQDKFLGKILTIKFQELTPDGIPRFNTFPQKTNQDNGFWRFREDV